MTGRPVGPTLSRGHISMVELFKNIRVDWLGKRRLFFAITIFLVLIGAVSIIAKRGFRYGVDFKGGTLVRVQFNEKVDIGKVRTALPDAVIQDLITKDPSK